MCAATLTINPHLAMTLAAGGLFSLMAALPTGGRIIGRLTGGN